jgi:hypothetical protein
MFHQGRLAGVVHFTREFKFNTTLGHKILSKELLKLVFYSETATRVSKFTPVSSVRSTPCLIFMDKAEKQSPNIRLGYKVWLGKLTHFLSR